MAAAILSGLSGLLYITGNFGVRVNTSRESAKLSNAIQNEPMTRHFIRRFELQSNRAAKPEAKATPVKSKT